MTKVQRNVFRCLCRWCITDEITDEIETPRLVWAGAFLFITSSKRDYAKPRVFKDKYYESVGFFSLLNCTKGRILWSAINAKYEMFPR